MTAAPVVSLPLRTSACASVPCHSINAVRPSPFPDWCEIMEQAGIDPNETISLNSGESSDPVTGPGLWKPRKRDRLGVNLC